MDTASSEFFTLAAYICCRKVIGDAAELSALSVPGASAPASTPALGTAAWMAE